MKQAFERHLRALRDRSNRVSWAVELAEHDLVLAEEDRAEVPDVRQERPRHPTIERVEYRLEGSCEAFASWLQLDGCVVQPAHG